MRTEWRIKEAINALESELVALKTKDNEDCLSMIDRELEKISIGSAIKTLKWVLEDD